MYQYFLDLANYHGWMVKLRGNHLSSYLCFQSRTVKLTNDILFSGLDATGPNKFEIWQTTSEVHDNSFKDFYIKSTKDYMFGCFITNLKNNKGLNVKGNTNTVYINPLNSLKFVLNKIRKEKVKLEKDFYVFTGSTVGVVPIKNKGEYIGKVDKIGSVRTTIN